MIGDLDEMLIVPIQVRWEQVGLIILPPNTRLLSFEILCIFLVAENVHFVRETAHVRRIDNFKLPIKRELFLIEQKALDSFIRLYMQVTI